MDLKLNNDPLFQSPDLVFDPNDGVYMRSTGTYISEASDAIAMAYGAKNAYLFPSGMNAIYNTLKFICREQLKKRNNGLILYSNEMYCDTGTKTIPLLAEDYPSIEFMEFDIRNQGDLFQKIRSRSKDLFAVFMESASNPNSHMVDWNSLKIPSNAFLIVDNTWLSPINFNPFEFKADIVVDSCTKYISAGRCIGGVTIFNGYDRLSKQFFYMLKSIGNHVSPINCALIEKGVKNLEQTITTISERTDKVLEYLKNNEHVDQIVHPSLEYHPSYKKFQKYTKGYRIGIIYFRVPNPNLERSFRNSIGEIVEQTSIQWHTSYGKSYDLFCRFCKKDDQGVWLRLSVGYDENPSILTDLELVCKEITQLNSDLIF